MAEPPKFSIILGDMYPADRAVKCGVLAEEHGFNMVFIPDHLTDINGARIDCWTVLGGIAARTSRVMLSPGVADVHHIHPAKMAQMAATLDELSGGRAMVALGAGEAMNITPFGIEFESGVKRLRRVEEYMDVLRLLWRASRENIAFYEGEFYRLSEAFIDQKCVRRPHPPIYIGALRSKRMLKLIGRKADGWLSWIILPERFAQYVQIIRESAEEAGRGADEVDTVVWMYFCLSDNPEVVKKAVEVGKAYLYVEGSILEEHGYEPPKLTYSHMLAHKPFPTAAKLLEACRDVPEWLAEKAVVVGDVDKCVERIAEYVKAGAKNLGFRIMTIQGAPTIEETIREISRSIMPHFKSRKDENSK